MKVTVTTSPARAVVSQAGPVNVVGRAVVRHKRVSVRPAAGAICLRWGAKPVPCQTPEASVAIGRHGVGVRVAVRGFDATALYLRPEGVRIGVRCNPAAGHVGTRPSLGRVLWLAVKSVGAAAFRSTRGCYVPVGRANGRLSVQAAVPLRRCMARVYPATIAVVTAAQARQVIATGFPAVAPQLGGQSRLVRATVWPASVHIAMGGTRLRTPRHRKMAATPRRVYVGSSAHN